MVFKEKFLGVSQMKLVFQAYGQLNIIHQNIFSIFSLLDKLNGQFEELKIIVYTDNVNAFEKYFTGISQISYRKIDAAQIKKWRGAIDFVHRVKVEILKEVSEQYHDDVFYVDGDTLFLDSPIKLFKLVDNNNSLMHICENVISAGKDPLSKKIKKYLKKYQPDISIHTSMWNAGVLGISKSVSNCYQQVLDLTDKMYSQYPKHVMEQLAFSYVLQNQTQIHPADKVILHYWNQKDEYQILINTFLEQNLDLATVQKNWNQIQWPAAPSPKLNWIQKIKKQIGI